MNKPSHTLRIRRSARAKRLRLAVRPGLIELVAPLATPEAQAVAFLNRHRAWAEAKVLELNERAALGRVPTGFASSPTVPWRGAEIPLLVQEQAVRRVRVAVDDAVRIILPEGLGEARDEVAKQALFGWVRRWLHGHIATLAGLHAPRYGLHPREIRVKRMKTRWGSCGPRNDININWLLAFTPEPVLEYVVVHELCHIRERNHSPAFWALLASHLPDYLQQRQWLRAYGLGLMQRF